MSTGRHAFRHNDAARLLRATAAAGLKVTGVTLDAGKVTVLVEDAAQTAINASDDKVENWMKKHNANQR
jgi:hypothetical protein